MHVQLTNVDWIEGAVLLFIAVAAILVYARVALAALRPLEGQRAALPDGGLRRRASARSKRSDREQPEREVTL